MIRFLILISLLFIVTACASDGNVSDPAETVIQYMQAKVDGDKETLSTLLCAEMESILTRESQSFATVDAVLEDATCQRDDDSETVTCTGAIVADYGGEDTEFPLTSYRVIQEDGMWKWCGEAES